AYVRFAEEHPGHYRVLFTAAAPAGVSEERARHPGGPSFTLLLDTIQRCLDAGAPVPPGGMPGSSPPRCGSPATG
ncbi:MAG TPA: TetR-like C-terminal domain-containing protein, partial [Acidimicrobiales bacterium]|nr:TetR-like C-terminal domain-containing protein [Acidimicrobiales bacterium]